MKAPERVGNYRLVRLLGEGGMGAVHLAEHVDGGLRAAVKVLLPHVSADKQIVGRFFNEARAANRIQHPGIVRVSDMGYTPDGHAYLVMELLDGESLAARLDRGAIDTARALEIARQAAGALAASHAAGIVHRDLKPDNMFLVGDPDLKFGERCKLLDFGIAKLADATGSYSTQATMGTPAYMAPEQWRDTANVDGRADVYALGCVLFQMLTGRLPFAGPSLAAFCHQHTIEPPPDPAVLAPHLAAPVTALVRAMLAKEPGQRPASMEEVAARLGAARTDPPAPTPAVTPAKPLAPHEIPTLVARSTTLGAGAGQVDRTARRSARWPLVIGGVVVAAAGALAIVLSRGDDDDPVATADAAVDAATSIEAAAAATPIDAAPDPNPFVSIAPPAGAVVLGVSKAAASRKEAGFAPSRRVLAPTVAYAIQAHEVTWAELEPWLATQASAVTRPAEAGPGLPATGVPWDVAQAYCASLGGGLPTEAQWEYAARGPERRAHPWGDRPVARDQLHALAGPGATPRPVMTTPADRTPDGIHDLAGNVREWTADEWTADHSGEVPSWARARGRVHRVIRGLPLEGDADRLPESSAAWRELLCAAASCPDDTAGWLAYVGFRCVR